MFICSHVDTVACMYEWLMDSLGEKAYTESPCSVDNAIVDMYHSGTDSENQDRITRRATDPSSGLRCIVATVAFGLGVNMTDVDLVINWGPPKDLLQYWQEVGRAGRDGRRSSSIEYNYPRSVVRGRTEPAMINFISDVSQKGRCLRKLILKTFELPGLNVDSLPINERCCVNCHPHLIWLIVSCGFLSFVMYGRVKKLNFMLAWNQIRSSVS